MSIPNDKFKTPAEFQLEKYKSIFEESPIPIIEGDGRNILEAYRRFDIQDPNHLYQFLIQNPQEVISVFQGIKIVDVNREAFQLFEGDSREQLIADFPGLFTKIPDQILANLFVAMAYQRNYFETETRMLTFHGQKVYVLMRITVPESCRENLSCLIMTFGNITELKQRELRLEKMAQMDGLTQLLNHKAIVDRLEKEFMRASRHNSPLSCLMIDVDKFKQVNDQFGHTTGDQLLQSVSHTLRQTLRQSDIVGRYGGDEFFVILPETKPTQAQAAAIRISDALAERTQGIKKGIAPTYSIGVSTYPSKSIKKAKDLVSAADQAMYKSKAKIKGN